MLFFKRELTVLTFSLKICCVLITHYRVVAIVLFSRASHLHPLNKADGSARSNSHSFSQTPGVLLEYTQNTEMSTSQLSCNQKHGEKK